MLDAQMTLAEMMVNGRGGPRDHTAALALFAKAAEQGHVGGMFALGAMHGGGHDVVQNRPLAEHWFRRAAERGHPHAQLMLGRYLARGLAGTLDPAEARRWLERAQAQGLAEAGSDLARLHAPPPAPATAERRDANCRPTRAGGPALTPDTPAPVMTSAEFFAEQARLAWQRGEAALAGDALPEARRWLERAARFAPADDTIGFALATALLRAGDPAAADRFGAIAGRHDRREAWLGLAAAHRAAGRQRDAVAALTEALCRHAPDPACAALLDSLAREAGLPGWCGVAGDGRLLIGALARGAQLRVRLDDETLRLRGRRAEGLKLPPRWRQATRLDVSASGAPLLGSPVALAAIRRVEGFVAVREGGIEGWAWHPHDPETEPVITIRDIIGDAVRSRARR